MLNAVQLDTVCVFATVTCECPLNFPIHSITFSYMDNSDYATCSLVYLDFLPHTNCTVYVINTHRHALEQLSQDCMVRLWLLTLKPAHKQISTENRLKSIMLQNLPIMLSGISFFSCLLFLKLCSQLVLFSKVCSFIYKL